MASSDRIDFNLTGHDWAPNKFTRKNIIRRITCDGSSGRFSCVRYSYYSET